MIKTLQAAAASLLVSFSAFAETSDQAPDVDAPEINDPVIETTLSGTLLREELNIPGYGPVVFTPMPIAQLDVSYTPADSDWSYTLQAGINEIKSDAATFGIESSGIVPANILVGASNDAFSIQAGRFDNLFSPHSIAWNAFLNGLPPVEAEEISFLETAKTDVIGAQASYTRSLSDDSSLTFHGSVYQQDSWNPVYLEDMDIVSSNLGPSFMASAEYNNSVGGINYALAGEFAQADYAQVNETRFSAFGRASGEIGEADWMAIAEINGFENRLGFEGEDGVTTSLYGQIQGPLNDVFSWHVAALASQGSFESTPLTIAPQAGIAADLCQAFKGEACENGSLSVIGAYAPKFYPDQGHSEPESFGIGLNYARNF